ncbi:aromatic ring-hydroxylating oxygenase subunit alpha [Paraburkholderia flagellata]|uniref:aromatic ring-hydroxylating oxygenase subunit alpha n=1 Tax=Paraburkholderia flagellata TaxID=2883241 RepID=UPI001F1BD45A|nr:aromatic ring-hydroxylating dioxygenase subunit alpha [Paraburkholderia flagellata]
MAVIENIIERCDAQRHSAPGAVLSGLPTELYTSEAVFDREQERVFARNWTLIGFAHELATPGTCIPVTAGGQPLLIVSNEAGEIGVFHNVCRHRGLKLVDKPCNVKQSITCPYHAWSYGLDGALEAAPHFGGFRIQEVPGFSRADNGLVPVRHVVWHDWIFVNISGDAPSFEEYSRPFAEQMKLLDTSKLRPIGKIDLGEVKCNWKFLMENFIEPYHVPIVHDETAAGQPLKDHYTISNGVCLGSGVDLEDQKNTTAQSSHLDMSARYLTMFPNFVLGIYLPDQAGVHLNIPVGPDRTRQFRVLYSVGEQHYTDESKKALCALWYDVHKEDHAIAELLQEGRTSSVMRDGGVMSPHWEDSAHGFQQLVVDALRG